MFTLSETALDTIESGSFNLDYKIQEYCFYLGSRMQKITY